MQHAFTIQGHPNILSTHKNTLEFTKDEEITPKGNCIVGVNATFSLEELKNLLTARRLLITLESDGLHDSLTALPNPRFNSGHELVIRIGEFDSERTFAVRSDKSSNDIDRRIIAHLKAGKEATVTITTI